MAFGKKRFSRGAKPPQGKPSRSEPPTNAALLAALEAGRGNPDADRTSLFEAMRDATLLVPLTEPPPAPGPSGRADMKFLMLKGGEKRALAGFTDLDALRRFLPQAHVPWAAMPTPELCRIAVEGSFDRIVINPGGPIGYEMTPVVFQALTEGQVPDASGRKLAVQIGMPVQRPSAAALEALRNAVARPGVREVYWFWIAVSGGQPHLGLAVDPPTPVMAQALGPFVETVWREHSPDNPLLDVLALDESELAQTIRREGERLYRHAEE